MPDTSPVRKLGFHKIMNTQTTLIRILLSATASLALTVAAQAQFNYYVNNNNTAVLQYYSGPGGTVVVPATIDSYPVTAIQSYTFYGQGSITNITLPASVTNIDARTFGYCAGLLGFTVAANNPAFGTTNGVLCNQNLTTLVAFPAGRTGSYSLPGGITSLADEAFYGCASLTNIVLPNGLTGIGNEGFLNCSSLVAITLPGSLTNLGYSAFFSCTNLASVVISNGLTAIADQTFSGCSHLASLTLPASVTNLGGLVFANCTSLTAITAATNNPAYASVGGVLLNKGQNTLVLYPPGRAGNYAVPNDITSIADNAFNSCLGLTGVTLPASLTDLGNQALAGCTRLTNATLAYGVTNIGTSAFNACSSLAAITLPGSVTSIGDNAFDNCSSLAAVTLNPGVTSIGNSTFSGCTSLASFMVPGSVRSIGGAAFGNCASLTAITISNGVTGIGSSAFSSCASLARITLPNSVTNLADELFQGCGSLTNVVIGSGVTAIGHLVFYGCTNLTSLYFLGGVPSVNADSFVGSTYNNNPGNPGNNQVVVNGIPATGYYPPGAAGWKSGGLGGGYATAYDAIFLPSGGNNNSIWLPGLYVTPGTPPVAGPAPTPPALGINLYSNQPAVFFPTATGTNFVLQMTTNLAGGNWVTVSNGIPISGLIITNPPANAFFRLH